MSAALRDGPPIVLIAGVAANGVIGDGLAIPWRLSSDLKRFKSLTIGKPVILGRRTFQSIGRPLPDRLNIVVSRDGDFVADGTVTAGSFEEAIKIAAAACAEKAAAGGEPGEICVAGGAAIYAAGLPVADRLEITRVEATPDGDVVFPEVDWSLWRRIVRQEHPAGPRDDHPFAFETFVRVIEDASGEVRL